MSTPTDLSNIKPFHESILDMIDQSNAFGLSAIGQILRTTQITQNHDEIAAAIRRQVKLLSYSEGFGAVVSEHVLAQKNAPWVKKPKEPLEVQMIDSSLPAIETK